MSSVQPPQPSFPNAGQSRQPQNAAASAPAPAVYKIPESVLVVIYRDDGQVLLVRRTVPAPEGVAFWQSVTGSKDFESESWHDTAVREVREETGIDALAEGCVLQDWNLENIYAIYPEWQHRYAPGVWHNRERVWGLRVPSYMPVFLNPREHTAHAWHDWRAAAQQCYSASNAEAILLLPRYASLEPDCPGALCSIQHP